MLLFHACVYMCMHDVYCWFSSRSFAVLVCLYIRTHTFMCVSMYRTSFFFASHLICHALSWSCSKKSEIELSKMDLLSQTWIFTTTIHRIKCFLICIRCCFLWVNIHCFFSLCTFLLTVREEFAASVENSFQRDSGVHLFCVTCCNSVSHMATCSVNLAWLVAYHN